MIGGIPRQFQSEIRFDRCADVRRAAGVDAPAAVFILMAQNPVRGLLKSFLISCAEQGVQQDVIGLESGIGFEFAAPVTVFVLFARREIFGRRRSPR